MPEILLKQPSGTNLDVFRTYLSSLLLSESCGDLFLPRELHWRGKKRVLTGMSSAGCLYRFDPMGTLPVKRSQKLSALRIGVHIANRRMDQNFTPGVEVLSPERPSNLISKGR